MDVTVASSVRALLDPQKLLAVTEIVPPEDPTVTVMTLVMELPVQPDGSVQV